MSQGRHKNIETPDKMWALYCEYEQSIRENPLAMVEQRKGQIIIAKGADIGNIDLNPTISLPVRRPLTLEGFENYCFKIGVINDLGDYFKNKDNRYADFAPICHRIKNLIREDQIEGGMCGLYNPSITQRLNGLVEKQETKHEGEIKVTLDLSNNDS